jgi:hypothetical protein
MMRDVFQNFLVLKLIGLLALLTVGAVALGLSSLARDSNAAGAALLIAAAVLATATAWLVAHRPKTPPR